MSINFCARCASRITHKPKRKQEKKTAKKKKKESLFSGARHGLSRFFGKKYYLTDNYSICCRMMDEVEIFLQKCILTLQTMSVGFSKPPIFAFFFIFWVYG
jgi:hypothetical protein